MKYKTAYIYASMFFVVFLIFSFLIGLFFYNNINALKQGAVIDRQSIASVTATAVKVKISHLVDVASLMASNNNVITDIADGKWENAASVIRDLQNNINYYDTYIDRIVLIDPKGIERAAYPELVGGIGADFSSSSYFQKLSSGAPYAISNVILRASRPQINVINLLVPVSNNGKILGVIGLQLPTDGFLEFSNDVLLGTYGYTYIVDSAGNIVASPKFSFETNIINVASTPVVHEVLSGNSGYYDSYNDVNDERSFIAYTPVPLYGWGVILQEPYNEVFGSANNILLGVEIKLFLFVVLDAILTCLIFLW